MAPTKFEDILKADFVPSSDDDWEWLDVYARQVFLPTAPIDEGRLFVGRLSQIRALLDVIYQRGAHAIIFGERGVGKTSLVNIINDRVIGPSRFNKVLKISCAPNDTFTTVWSNVFFPFSIDGKPVSESIAANPQPFTVYKIAESLPTVSSRYLIILDEFDRIQNDEAKTLIADTIKYFSDNPLKFTILVVGVGNSIEQLFGSHPSIQRCCVQIRMPRMSPQELREIVDTRLPKLHMRTSTDVTDKMVQFSQGLPGYMHLLGLLSARNAISERQQTIKLGQLELAVSQALEKADESTRRDYYKAIQSTKPDNRYREVLLACALVPKNELGQFSASDVCVPYSLIMKKPVGIEHFARHLSAFCDADRGPALIKSGKPKRFMYHFANPLLEPLVAMIGRQEA